MRSHRSRPAPARFQVSPVASAIVAVLVLAVIFTAIAIAGRTSGSAQDLVTPLGSAASPTDARVSTQNDTTTSSSSAPSMTPPAAATGSWPGPANTGVPAGTVLTKYNGPCSINAVTALESVDASACSSIDIHVKNVVIKNSLLPRLDVNDPTGSVNVSDSTVRAGNTSMSAVSGSNIVATRIDATGGQHTFGCESNCTVVDSWLHGQYNPDGESYHNNAFLTNGGSTMVVRHNTLHCTAIVNANDGGCTGDLSIFGDFSPVSNVLVENNLFKANASSISFCVYGGYNPDKPYPMSTDIRFRNNVFERGVNGNCGVYGPVTAFLPSATGNDWSGNVWDDGTVLASAS